MPNNIEVIVVNKSGSPLSTNDSSLYFNNDQEIPANGELDISNPSLGNDFAEIQKDEWLHSQIESGSVVLKHDGVELDKSGSIDLITVVSMHELNNKFQPKV